MEWKFFQLWAKAGCGMYVEESKSQRDKETKRQKDKRREQEQMGRWKDREKDRERPRVEEVLHATL